jgi:tripeptide aminopeptidase
MGIQGIADKTMVELIVRDFDTKEAEAKVRFLKETAESVVAGHAKASVSFESYVEYRNMKDALAEVPEVVDLAARAIENAGLEPRHGSIRGGTDGTMLTERGLPTPNIFSGAHDFHSVKEWVCVADMAAAAVTIVELAKLWAQQTA